jgi:hypothetical protein
MSSNVITGAILALLTFSAANTLHRVCTKCFYYKLKLSRLPTGEGPTAYFQVIE